MYTVRNGRNYTVINFLLWLQGHDLWRTNAVPNKERLLVWLSDDTV